MSTELIINSSLPETRIALMEGGEIQELLIERATGKGIVGNIYKGKVTRVLPGMQAAFVDIGLEKAAFLYVDDVYTDTTMWEDPEEAPPEEVSDEEAQAEEPAQAASISENEEQAQGEPREVYESSESGDESEESFSDSDEEGLDSDEDDDIDDEGDEDDDGDGEIQGMGPPPSGGEGDGEGGGSGSSGGGEGASSAEAGSSGGAEGGREGGNRNKRFRRGRRQSRGGHGEGRGGGRGGNRHRKDRTRGPGNYINADPGTNRPDQLAETELPQDVLGRDGSSDHGQGVTTALESFSAEPRAPKKGRPEFKETRGRDRRIPKRGSLKPSRSNVSIQDLLKEGQEVIVQVAKDPISSKGARLTCHLSLPGRHLVCMPTINHVGVSRRIDRDDERRKLRALVEEYRPKNLGFIVRTASSGKGQAERRVKQDIDYLVGLWEGIRERAAGTTAPALIYEDLNSVLRSIRDWVTEDIDKIIVDSRYHFNEIQKFASSFMPSLKQKVELYQGDIPVFDAYGISTELSRSLERKVWLKSGGYIVVDQAEALVAIDVNTGRFVGKKNLEDTILKTNLEAVNEIAYQLRLRNCGGIIIIDLIDMEKDENRQRVYRALEEALKKDRARPTILKISELGLVEMTRKRTRDTIIRTLCESCNHCEGKGYIKSKQSVAYELLREIERVGIERDLNKILIQAHPDAIDILAIDERDTLDQLERRYRKEIFLQAIEDFHPEQFEITTERSGEKGADRGEGAIAQKMSQVAENRRAREAAREAERQALRAQAQANPIKIKPLERPIIKPLDKPIDVRSIESPEFDESGESSDFGGDSSGEQSEMTQDYSPEQSDHQDGPSGGSDSREPAAQFDEDNVGNSIVSRAPVISQKESRTVSTLDTDDDFTEEDRRAFLLAQATQDAAIATLTAHTKPGAERTQFGGGGGGRGGRNNDRGGRGGRDGGRGGRFGRKGRFGGRGGRDRDRGGDRGGWSRGPSGPAGGGSAVSAAPIAPVSVAPTSVSSARSGSGSSDDSSGSEF